MPSFEFSAWTYNLLYMATLSLSQVRSLSSFLEMEGYDRTPFTPHQLESFHRLVAQRLDQEKETVAHVLVRNSLFYLTKVTVVSLCVIFYSTDTIYL